MSEHPSRNTWAESITDEQMQSSEGRLKVRLGMRTFAAGVHEIGITEREAKLLFIELGEALGIENAHYVVFTEDGWTIEHSMGCRLSGDMTQCETNAVVTNDCRNGQPEWVVLRDGRARYKLVFEEEYDNWTYAKVES